MSAAAETRPRPGPVDWVDQKLNAILVKDVRAWLRSKKFLIVFFVAMVLIQVITFVVTAIPRPETGHTLFLILTSGLAFFLVGVLPFLMHDRFTDELSSGSTELALISRMTPGMLVRGKIASGVAASLLFFAAAGPSLTIAYMLGGVDLILLFYIVALLLFSSVISMVMAILLVSITGKRKLKFLGLLPIAAGVGMVVVVVAMAEIVQKEEALLDVEFLFLNIVFAGYVALFALFFYTVAVSRLSFEADNRDLRPRLALSALTVLPVLLGLGLSILIGLFPSGPSDPEVLVIVCVIVSLNVFVFGSFFVMSTPDRVSARIKSRATRFLPVRLVFYPGPGRLYTYILLHLAFFGAASLLPEIIFSVDDEVTLGLLTASLIATPTVLGGCTLVHWGITRLPSARIKRLPRGLTVAILAFVWCAASIPLGVLVEALDLPEMALIIHPVTAIVYVADEESGLALLGALIVNGFIMGPAIIYWAKEIIQAIVEEIQLTASHVRGVPVIPPESPAEEPPAEESTPDG